jgi:hypothetical protein
MTTYNKTFLCDPVEDTMEEYAILPLIFSEQPRSMDASHTFSMTFSQQKSQFFKKYRVIKHPCSKLQGITVYNLLLM